jgi:hypothetical protein
MASFQPGEVSKGHGIMMWGKKKMAPSGNRSFQRHRDEKGGLSQSIATQDE